MNKNLSRRSRSRTAKGVFTGALLALALGTPTKIAQAQIQNLTSFHDAGQHVFYVDLDRHVHHVYCSTQYCGNWANQDLTDQTGIRVWSVAGAVASHIDTAGGMHVFVVDDSRNLILHELYCLNSCDQAHNWTARTLASNVWGGVTSYNDGRSEFVYYLSGGHLWVMVIGLWETIDLTLQTGAPPPTRVAPNGALNRVHLTAFSDVSGEHLFYEASTGHICQITGQWVWVDNGEDSYQDVSWSKWDGSGDLTAQAGGTPETAPWPSPLTSFSDALGEHVAFIGTDENVYEYRYDVNTGKWQLSPNLSGAVMPPLQGSALTSFSDDFGEHIYYEGVDNHIYRLYRNSCYPWGDACTWGPWTDLDFTQTANGVPASIINDNLTSFSHNMEYAVYVAERDWHLHRITTWVDQDLQRQ